jgi:hypothetical protein
MLPHDKHTNLAYRLETGHGLKVNFIRGVHVSRSSILLISLISLMMGLMSSGLVGWWSGGLEDEQGWWAGGAGGVGGLW